MTVGTDGLTLRLIARHAQLVRALREADLKFVARAGSRARLADLELLPKERAAAQSARATLGRALREARLRAKQPHGPLEIAPTVAPARGKRRSRVAALLLIAALLLLAVLGWTALPAVEPAPAEDVDPGGAPTGGVLAQVQTNDSSRGRTSDLYLVVAAPSVEPSPTPEATASPEPRTTPRPVGPAGSGGGAGGAGGVGTGTGTGVGPGRGPGVASPAPTATPAPTPVPTAAASFTRIRGRVIDSATGQGIPGVCLVPGSLECDASSHYSDANGYWWIDVTTGAYWDMRFQGSGYRVNRIRVFAGGREINVGNVRLLRSTPTPTPPPA
jgi:hypothetical protein